MVVKSGNENIFLKKKPQKNNFLKTLFQHKIHGFLIFMFEFAVFYKKKNRLVITVKVTYTAELTSWVKPSSSAKYHYPCRCWNQ